ncbi:hypothetical protein J7E73_01755 [Paenibacillus albidus]|uniref:hypothetical protein n=1 Tax=Paenibacillus albidus TaxID=2041023 RepID=UPI001BE83B27|nr:hypothetical protein [Paenibacillus albidus]MBT2287870.1 hypothetical protein [Paenibacillus albidus]
MKLQLITIQAALDNMEQWVGIPSSHELISSGIFRNPEYEGSPFYTIELEWNQKGEPALDEDGLVNVQTIRAILDACTGRMVAFYRHDHRREAKQPEVEMTDALYEKLYPQVLGWISRLDLQVDPAELRLVRKSVTGGIYRLSYLRHSQGIPLADYQTLEIKLNQDFELLHINCVWDECTFAPNEALIPPEVFIRQLDSRQLSLGYISLLASRHPYYICREDVYDAATGELICTDQAELIEQIDMKTARPQRNQPIRILHQPIFTADYNVLRLEEGVTEADPYAPHVFFNPISDDDVAKAKDIAVSYLKQYQDGNVVEFAFFRKEGREVVESMRGNQVVVEIQRMVHGIPVMGAGIRLVIDHTSWEVKNVVDTFIFKNQGTKLDLKQLLAPVITADSAWEQLKDKPMLKLQYRFAPAPSPLGTKRAVLTYALDCDWICDASTGELTRLD